MRGPTARRAGCCATTCCCARAPALAGCACMLCAITALATGVLTLPAAMGAGPAYAERSAGAPGTATGIAPGVAAVCGCAGWAGAAGGGYRLPAGTLDGGGGGLACWRAANAGSIPAPAAAGADDRAPPAAAEAPDEPLAAELPPAALPADLPCPGVGKRFRVSDPSGLVWARKFRRCPTVHSMPGGSSNKRPRSSKAS